MLKCPEWRAYFSKNSVNHYLIVRIESFVIKLCIKKDSKDFFHTVGVPHDVKSDVELELFIWTLHVDSVDPDKSDWTETSKINEHNVVFKLDTGAQANIIPKHIFDKLELPDKQLTNSKVRLVVYGGAEIIAEGTTTLECSVRDRKYDLPFFIVHTTAQSTVCVLSA